METTTIRVTAQTRDQLNSLARRRGTSAGEVVAELVRAADDEALLAEAAASWSRLGEDARALSAYHAESDELAGFGDVLPEY